MDLTRSAAAATNSPAAPILQPESSVRTEVRSDLRNDAEVPRKSTGYGLPCAKCRLYYPASLDTCPACKSRDRVSPSVAAAIPAAQPVADIAPDAALIEQERVEKEREEFLKQFKSQLYAAHAEVASSPVVCTLGEHHAQDAEAASICKPCYDRLQERVDVFEAALHIDLKEAAQIVYDAVWADPSDPNKTYSNAASALITELRKRSGASSLLGPFHPLGN